MKRKTYIKLLLLIFLVLGVSSQATIISNYSQSETIAGEKYCSGLIRLRALGDKALDNKIFNRALEYYEQYRDMAIAKRNRIAIKDAYKCIISALLLAQKPDNAEVELKKFAKQYGIAEHIRTSLYKTDILILRKKYTVAEKKLRKILKNLTVRNTFYFHAISSLGYVYIKLGKWEKALTVYDHLQVTGKGTEWYKKSLKWKIYALLMSKKIKEANLIINSLNPKDLGSPRILKLLKMLLLTLKNNSQDALKIYKEIEKDDFSSIDTNDELLFLSLSKLAYLLVKQKKYNNAIPCLENAMFFSPDSDSGREILSLLIKAYEKSEKINLAIDAAKRYLLYYPRAVNRDIIKLKLGYLLSKLSRNTQALKIYKELISGTTSVSIKCQAAIGSSDIYYKSGNLDMAIKNLTFFIEHTSDKEKKLRVKYKKALILMEKEEFEAAYKIFLQVANSFPDMCEDALLNAIQASYKAENYNNVITTAENFLKKYPTGRNYKDVIILEAYAYKRLGKLNIAKELFDSFAKKYPNNPFTVQALYETAIINFDQCDFRNADKVFSLIIKNYPKSDLIPEVLYKRLYSRYFDGKEQLAIEDCKLLSKKYPESEFTIHALFWAADYFREMKMFDRAITYLDIIISSGNQNKTFKARALYEKAYISFLSGNPDNTLDILRKIIAAYPEKTLICTKSFLLTGDIYANRSEYKKAVEFFKKAEALSPDTQLKIAASGRRADCLFSMYHKDLHNNNTLLKAIEVYKKILADTSISSATRTQTLYKLARTFEVAGNTVKALEYYDKLILNYEVDIVDKYVESIWLTKGMLAAAKLCERKKNPKTVRKAMKYYKALLKYGDLSLKEYKQKIRALRRQFRRL